MTRHILLESLYVTVHEPTSGVRPAATERNARTFLREALALAGDVDAEGGHRSSRDGRTVGLFRSALGFIRVGRGG